MTKKRVLLVDDSEVVLAMAGDALEKSTDHPGVWHV